jgi:hypothetical protein
MNVLNILYQKIQFFACRNFSTGNSGNFEDNFLVGFRNWKKACALYLCFIYNFLIIIINIHK